MIRIFQYLLFVVIFSALWSSVEGQEWESIIPIFEQPGIYDMSLGVFVDENNGWFTETYPGRTWHTTDGGHYWSMQKDGNEVWSNNISFTNKSHGWIVCTRVEDLQGLLWMTNDEGMHWQEFSTQAGMTGLLFMDTLTGFMGGSDRILKTTNGGISWHNSEIDTNHSFYICDIFMIDSLFGWAVGGNNLVWDTGIILNTVDGGVSWQVNVPVTMEGRAIFFTDRLHGIIVGSNPPIFEGVVMKTDDGGGHWAIQYLPCTWLRDVVFTSDSVGWVVGHIGVIWKTEDAGRTWSFVESGTYSDLNRIVFVEDGRIGYIFGENGTLLRYEDASGILKEAGADEQPSDFVLYPNYPNPFNGETTIEYELPNEGFVNLYILNLTDEKVKTLEAGRQNMGKHVVKWNGKDDTGIGISSGVYLCLLKSGIFNRTQKIVLNR